MPSPTETGSEVAPGLNENWPWLLAGAALLLLLYLLAPILMPFVVGAGLAYLGDPLVDRFERLGLSRTLGVSLVFAALVLGLMLSLLLLVPPLQEQFATLLHNVPDWLRWVQDVGLPRLGLELPRGLRFDAEGMRQMLSGHWSQASGVFKALWTRISGSSAVLLTAVANLFMIPIVTFYLLRDWDRLVAWLRDVLPPRMLPRVSLMATETDQVLSAFIRGQLLVMAAQAVYYALALWLAGLDLALILGLIVGLISFVPYLGFIGGITMAAIAMLVQTQELLPLVWVGLVFTIGQLLESNVLTPWLVGDRIGLHPVAVIFAVMAGGQLFGFVGVLLALPVAAVIAVLLRHAKQEWLRSPLYLGARPPPGSEDR